MPRDAMWLADTRLAADHAAAAERAARDAAITTNAFDAAFALQKVSENANDAAVAAARAARAAWEIVAEQLKRGGN